MPSEKPPMPYISPEDMKGVLERAKREGKTVEELQLRPSVPPAAVPVPEEQIEQDVVGILDRVRREQKPVDKLQLRRDDDPHAIFRAMRKLVTQAGFPVKGDESEDGRRDTGRISQTDLEALEDSERKARE